MSLTLEKVALPIGHRQHPLPHGKVRGDVIYQMRSCLGNAPRVARGALATALAPVGDQEIVLTLVAVGAGESVGEDDAFEIAAKMICYAALLLCLLGSKGPALA